MQVSAWDDDTDGIEEELNPKKSPTTEILWAAENGHLDVVERLLAEDPTLVNARDNDGYTPLHRSAYNNHVEVLEYLLNKGASHSANTEDNLQPLHSACRWNNAKCAAILLEYGADINAKSTGGQTPLHFAASNSYAKESLMLLLMNENIEPDLKNKCGETALDIARRTGRYYTLFELVRPCITQIKETVEV